MSNPWTKKNPFLSMWLSGANSVLGSARGRAIGEGRRQMSTLMQRNTQQMMRLWTGGFRLLPTAAPTPARKRKKSQRK